MREIMRTYIYNTPVCNDGTVEVTRFHFIYHHVKHINETTLSNDDYIYGYFSICEI
jgi:hypothetical protein